MAKENLELILGSDEREESRVHEIVVRAIKTKTAVFVGRFLRDMALTESVAAEWSGSNIMLRQYGHSCFVNAYPPLADAGRIEIGLDEAEAALQSDQYDIVLLSQILTAIDEHLLTGFDIARLIQVCPDRVTLILTGRNAPQELAAQCESRQQEVGQ